MFTCLSTCILPTARWLRSGPRSHLHTEKQTMSIGLLSWDKTAHTSKWRGGGQRRGLNLLCYWLWPHWAWSMGSDLWSGVKASFWGPLKKQV